MRDSQLHNLLIHTCTSVWTVWTGLPWTVINVVLVLCLINRYVEEHVQKTGVAIETQGFTFVTSGKKRESLTVRL